MGTEMNVRVNNPDDALSLIGGPRDRVKVRMRFNGGTTYQYKYLDWNQVVEIVSKSHIIARASLKGFHLYTVCGERTYYFETLGVHENNRSKK